MNRKLILLILLMPVVLICCDKADPDFKPIVIDSPQPEIIKGAALIGEMHRYWLEQSILRIAENPALGDFKEISGEIAKQFSEFNSEDILTGVEKSLKFIEYKDLNARNYSGLSDVYSDYLQKEKGVKKFPLYLERYLEEIDDLMSISGDEENLMEMYNHYIRNLENLQKKARAELQGMDLFMIESLLSVHRSSTSSWLMVKARELEKYGSISDGLYLSCLQYPYKTVTDTSNFWSKIKKWALKVWEVSGDYVEADLEAGLVVAGSLGAASLITPVTATVGAASTGGAALTGSVIYGIKNAGGKGDDE